MTPVEESRPATPAAVDESVRQMTVHLREMSPDELLREDLLRDGAVNTRNPLRPDTGTDHWFRRLGQVG